MIKVTGDIDFIAHSAWISTMNEIRAYARTHEDQERVVSFLVKNHHTSPLEGVTITFDESEKYEDIDDTYGAFSNYAAQINKLARFPFARQGGSFKVTIDLLNFCKATKCNSHGEFGLLWDKFSEERPELAKILEGFSSIENIPAEPVKDILNTDDITIQLVQVHIDDLQSHSRASWRVRCPLSISVQILRHRSGSYNQVSGRYKTIREKIFDAPIDCVGIAEKIGEDMRAYMRIPEDNINKYIEFMNKAKEAKDADLISNSEYKRLREVARFILPEGRMTELYITYYLDDFYDNYLPLRDSSHAQLEHIYVAQEMNRTLQDYFKNNNNII
jgi:thymidylate synthase ThyX